MNSPLPSQFVNGLKTLYDIIDDKKYGFIRIEEIEAFWARENPNITPGFLESLKKVSSPAGYVSFDNFLDAVRFCLFKSRLDHNGNPVKSNYYEYICGPSLKSTSPPGTMWRSRAASMPQLPDSDSGSLKKIDGELSDSGRSSKSSKIDRNAIYGVLRTWQIEKMKQSSNTDLRIRSVPPNYDTVYPRSVDAEHNTLPQRRLSNRRRRFTVGHVDYGLLRQLKLVEQEKDALLQGLDVVDRMREWYVKKLTVLQERKCAISKGELDTHGSEANQERANFLVKKIADLNQHLLHVIEEKHVVPFKLNTVEPSPSNPYENSMPNLIEENKRVVQEMDEKNTRIQQLEREKTSLIRDLFEARSRLRKDDDNTFM